jgi:hypothetical protein
MAFVSRRKSRIVICVAWFIINCTFELGQNFGSVIVQQLPKWFNTVPIFDSLRLFVVHGRFDIYDLLAISLGSLTAFLVGELLSMKGENNEKEY